MFEASRMATANHRIFGSMPIPRYVQLAELIRQRVAKRHWPPGNLLPYLLSEFDVARVTLRQAIALLADEDILSPQTGARNLHYREAGNAAAPAGGDDAR
jgi:GntR family transcriptional regulator